MADATGAPTSLGIHKYNTSVDAPSGLGFNSAMDDIDALLVARIPKTLLTTVGDIVYASGVSVAARLGIGAAGTVLGVAGGLPAWVTTAARFIVKGTRAANVSTVGTTFAGGADLLAAAISFTADGVSDYLVTVICAQAQTGGAANAATAAIVLDGAQNATILGSTFSNGQPVYAAGLVTPPAGVHTINVRIWSGGAWTTTFAAGAGGAAGVTPIIIGVEKAS